MSEGGGERTDRNRERGGGGHTDDGSVQYARASQYQYNLATTPAVDASDADACERFAAERARYLDRRTDEQFTDRQCEALAYRELGYSVSGIASHVDATAGTVHGWLDDWADRYGDRVLETRPQSDPVEVLE